MNMTKDEQARCEKHQEELQAIQKELIKLQLWLKVLAGILSAGMLTSTEAGKIAAMIAGG